MWWLIAAVALIVVITLWGRLVSDVEQPKYAVVETHDDIEIRDYAPKIIAEAKIAGERDKAISKGFRIIADYIFGNNLSSKKVAMTAPVTQQGDRNAWQVRFVMPANYTMETLPKPTNPDVKLKEIEGKRFAVIRFSGMAGEDSLKAHSDELREYLWAKNLDPLSEPTYAFYNPPWTLPFLRRNEVMIEISLFLTWFTLIAAGF